MELGPMVGFCEDSNEHSSSIQVLNFLTICIAIQFSSNILPHTVNELVKFTLDAEFSRPLF
jgi:hypothetical protein